MPLLKEAQNVKRHRGSVFFFSSQSLLLRRCKRRRIIYVSLFFLAIMKRRILLRIRWYRSPLLTHYDGF